jgi:hypothetical protein
VLGGPHEEIHEGHYFRAWYYIAALANDANIDLLVRTGQYQSHFVAYAACGGDGELRLHEDVTYATVGGNVPVWNANRQSAASGAEGNFTIVKVNPTIPVLGGNDLLWRFVPGGSVAQSPGSETGTRQEWILDPARYVGDPPVLVPRDYLVRVTNKSGLAQPVSVEIEWYEYRPG